MCCLLIQRTKKACDFGDKLSLRMILGSQSTYTLLNCSKWLEGRQRCNIEQKASTIYQQDNLNVFRQQNFLPVFYQKKAGDMPLAISSPHQHHALLCTLVCYGFRLLSLYIGHMLSNVNGPFSYTKVVSAVLSIPNRIQPDCKPTYLLHKTLHNHSIFRGTLYYMHSYNILFL